MDVKIKNFNCIKDIDLSFNPGFTILQGPSNSGKSSIVKAIENTIFNQSGTTNIRQGQDNYVVGIRKNGQTVSLIKGKNSKYKVNDQIFEKFGVSQLTEVADALNIRETVLGGEKVRLNFSHQMSYPFLLDKTPGQMYRFIVDSSESESLSNVLKDMSKDIKDAEKSIVQNDAQLDILIKQQTELNYKLLHADTILDISNQILNLDSTDSKLSHMSDIRDKYNTISKDVVLLMDRYNKLNVNLDTSLLDKLKEDYISYTSLSTKYNNLSKDIGSIKDYIRSLDTPVDAGELDLLCNNYTKLCELVKIYNNCIQDINNINSSIDVVDKAILNENDNLSKFKICPLCGSEIKC